MNCRTMLFKEYETQHDPAVASYPTYLLTLPLLRWQDDTLRNSRPILFLVELGVEQVPWPVIGQPTNHDLRRYDWTAYRFQARSVHADATPSGPSPSKPNCCRLKLDHGG